MSIEVLLTSPRYQAYLKTRPGTLSPRYDKLTDDQFVCLYAYTTQNLHYSYLQINFQLRRLQLDLNHYQLIVPIQEGIDAILKDRSSAFYYRYIKMGKAELLSKFAPGLINIEPSFTSVSGTNHNVISDDCNVLLRILPSTIIRPAYIAEISWAPAEDEYLYQTFTGFLVDEIEQLGDNEFEIRILEMPR